MKKRYLPTLALLLSGSSLLSTGAMPYCSETVHQIDIDQSTDLGFSARDLLNLAADNKYLDWGWDYRDGSSKLGLRAESFADHARYIDSVAVYPDGAPDAQIICANRVEVDAWLTFATDDGAFNERWLTKLYDTDGTDCMRETGDPCLPPGAEAKFEHKFLLETLNGNFYKEIVVPEDLTIYFYAQGRFSEQFTAADVYGQAYACSADVCYTYYIHGGHTSNGLRGLRGRAKLASRTKFTANFSL